MRHRKAGRKLGRNTNQRKMLLRNLAVSLIEHGSIVTTKAKAKELRRYVEKIITKVKHEDQSHAQRLVFKKLQNKEAVKKLFKEYRESFIDRPGGYTRIYLLGNRPGDAAEMAKISLILKGEVVVEEEPVVEEEVKEEVKEETKEEVKEEAPKKKRGRKPKAEKKEEEKSEAEEVKEEKEDKE
ncbi:large subunit ribosomal protein L17 [Thermotomaculum hydrothermale]|uniref:Large ribosomal subunit protein bL17 n=1 Tax=Thermotomaculum hydrothermale TaxID=981385 RepID=A0A7R6PMN2_9BACT|nr:50S ribosomal protein L17 [Thermotomaculum hydrothermale]BBB32902.1 large subunit ribosomal protein L17 [Thermotomaculum hydrothermale]